MPTSPTPSTIFGREPVVILAVLQALLALIVGFGLDMSGVQVGLIMAFATTITAVVARAVVVPVAKIRDNTARISA